MALDTELRTIEELLEYYNDSPESVYYYKIYVADPRKDIIFAQGDSEEELLKDLSRLHKNNMNRNKYFLSLFSENDPKKPYKSSSFQLHYKDKYISGVKEDIEELIDEEDEEETDYRSEIIGYIKKVFPAEQVSILVVNFLQNLMNKNNTMNQNNNSLPNAIAGITEEEIQILYSLMSKGVTIEHLRKLNSMDQLKLSSLLLML